MVGWKNWYWAGYGPGWSAEAETNQRTDWAVSGWRFQSGMDGSLIQLNKILVDEFWVRRREHWKQWMIWSHWSLRLQDAGAGLLHDGWSWWGRAILQMHNGSGFTTTGILHGADHFSCFKRKDEYPGVAKLQMRPWSVWELQICQKRCSEKDHHTTDNGLSVAGFWSGIYVKETGYIALLLSINQ